MIIKQIIEKLNFKIIKIQKQTEWQKKITHMYTYYVENEVVVNATYTLYNMRGNR